MLPVVELSDVVLPDVEITLVVVVVPDVALEVADVEITVVEVVVPDV